VLASPEELEPATAARSFDLLRWDGRSTVLPDDHPGAIEQATAHQTLQHQPHALGIVRRIEQY
jgi:hypothetical protein